MYRLVILEKDPTWASEVEHAVREVVQRTLLRDDVLKRNSVSEAMSDPLSPALVIYLASEEARDDPSIRAALDEAKAAAFAILPIGRAEAGLGKLLPDSIRRLNAIIWDGSRDHGVTIARLLGIVEAERKLFLSYRRVESEALALQLRRALSERGYDVFLDRFSVPPAADFQNRLDQELADKAFVVLIETASATNSPWVQHEIAYALSHSIAVLALSLPDADPDGKYAVIDNAFRVDIAPSQLQGASGATRELLPATLHQVLDEIELQAARQLRRRREQLLGALSDVLFTAGIGSTPVDAWALLADHVDVDPAVILVTPRSPTPHDVQAVDVLRRKVGLANCRGEVLHNVADRDVEMRSLLDWIIDGRPLAITTLTEFADEVTA